MKARIDELTYCLLPGESPPTDWINVYEEIFRCWNAVWKKTFHELDGNPELYSDDFTRQSLVGAVMRGERCVALGLFHRSDFSLATAGRDSYFKVWPETAKQKLIEDGPRVMVGSNITVDEAFRGDLGGGLRLKDVVLGLMVKTLLESEADVMTGTMRCNRGMHDAAYQLGASPLESGVRHHGVDVDLVAFYRRRIAKAGGVANLAVETLWRARKSAINDILKWETNDDRFEKTVQR